MEYIKTAIPDVWVLEPRVFEDARGYFMETRREEDFNRAIGHEVHFVQDEVYSVVYIFRKAKPHKPNLYACFKVRW